MESAPLFRVLEQVFRTTIQLTLRPRSANVKETVASAAHQA
jgi:hypothetical protein